MLLEADCIPCILRMAVAALRQLPLDENTIRELSTEILEIPALRGLDWNKTSAEVIEDIWRKIVKQTGSSDPFRSAKSNQIIPQNGIHFLDSAIIRLSHEIRHKIIIQCLLVRIWIIHTITILA
jgi:uncharacterized protein with ATP-grasp and redox domains